MEKNPKREASRTTEGSNVIVDTKVPAPTDMLSEFVEETLENIQHLFDDEDEKENAPKKR